MSHNKHHVDMKHYYPIIILILLFSGTAKSQIIHNGNFSQWRINSLNDTASNKYIQYKTPLYWHPLIDKNSTRDQANGIKQAIGVHSTNKPDNGVQLCSLNNGLKNSIIYHEAINVIPQKISGFYLYSNNASKPAVITVLLTHHITKYKKPEIIAAGQYEFSSFTNEYTPFELTLTHSNSTHLPDSIMIVIDYQDNTAGTSFIFDEIKVHLPTELTNNELPSIVAAPNPCTNTLWISGLSSHQTELVLFDTSGNIVQREIIYSTEDQTSLSLSKLKRGTYLLSVIQQGHTQVKKIVLR